MSSSRSCTCSLVETKLQEMPHVVLQILLPCRSLLPTMLTPALIPFSGLSSFLICLSPMACMLMQFNSTDPSSAVVLSGAFYFVGGVGMWIAALGEFLLVSVQVSSNLCLTQSFRATRSPLPYSPILVASSSLSDTSTNLGKISLVHLRTARALRV